MTDHAASTAADQEYDMLDGGTVRLGRTTYRVEVQRFCTGRFEDMVWLHGPSGGVYFLRGFLPRKDGKAETGERQVISWKSGQPLRSHGNEVRAVYIAGVLEQYVPATGVGSSR